MIEVDIQIGDTILGGRFKNKKIIVKSIGKDENNQITINGKPLLKYRIVKSMKKQNKIKLKDMLITYIDIL